MLISETYRQLNASLHDNPLYGTSGQHYVDCVRKLSAILKTTDILDYGCGKRTLEKSLGFAITNYDPCIEGLSTPPDAAEIVVCTEVMEHIEPEYLDMVLADLSRVTSRAIFLTIATGPASKVLADGRNAHLIQQPMEWWLPKLEKHFRMSRCWDARSGFAFIGQSLRDRRNFPDLAEIGPPPTTRKVVMKSVFNDEQRCENIRSSMLRGLPAVSIIPAHENVMTLVGYGPSLKYSIDAIRRSRGDIFTTSGAHHVLLDHGIVPMGHLESDPRPHKAKGFGLADKRVCYFIASAAAREVFGAVHGCETYIFHVTSSTMETNLISRMDPGAFTIDGGTNSGMMLIGLGTVLGYRKFEIYGMDCSFETDEEILYWPKDKPMPKNVRERVNFHAGLHPNDDQDLYRVWVGDRPFLSSPQMFQSAQDFMSLRANSKCHFNLHGDGFLKNFVDHIAIRKAA